MSGGSAIPANRPNGVFTAYYGDASSCMRVLIDKQDWAFAKIKTPAVESAKWAMAPQSGTVIDGPGFPGNTVQNGCYRGWE